MRANKASIPKRMIIVSAVHMCACVSVSIIWRYHAVILSLLVRLFIYDIYTDISFIFTWVLFLRGDAGTHGENEMWDCSSKILIYDGGTLNWIALTMMCTQYTECAEKKIKRKPASKWSEQESKKNMDFHWYCVRTGHKYWFVHLNVGMWIKSLLPFFCLLVDLFARFGVMPSRAPHQHTCTHTHHYRVLFQWNVISWYFYSLSYSRMSLSFCAAIWASSSVYCLFVHDDLTVATAAAAVDIGV